MYNSVILWTIITVKLLPDCWGGGLHSIFDHIISVENIFDAWSEFRLGKTSKTDIQEFHFNLESNIFEIHNRLKNKIWTPDEYIDFYIRDPKLRHIHKATVRDRVFNQALFRILYPDFDKNFIFDSYSCREDKGVHNGVLRLDKFLRVTTDNHRSFAFALKCDISKFFDNISHDILFGLIKKKVNNTDTLNIIKLILRSFEVSSGKGLPLGNVTSQLFANIYLNQLDQFVKHNLKAKYYVRYCDDFIIIDRDKQALVELIPKISEFLQKELFLKLHPRKVEIRKSTWGVDFLGYVILPHYIAMRTKTKKRMLKKVNLLRKQLKNGDITRDYLNKVLESYRGVLSHCHGYKIAKNIIY